MWDLVGNPEDKKNLKVCQITSNEYQQLCFYGKLTKLSLVYEPRSEKTGLRGFRPGHTQTGLCNH